MTAAKVNLKEGKKVLIGSFLSGNYHFLSGSYCNTLCTIYKRTSKLLCCCGIWFCNICSIDSLFFIDCQETKKEKEIIKKRKLDFFWYAASALNFFQFHIMFFVSVTLASYNLFYFDTTYVFIFVSGVVLGSFLVFYFT
jgi:hypothetical protein